MSYARMGAVSGTASTNTQWRGILWTASCARQ
jgi:hypothetical protein